MNEALEITITAENVNKRIDDAIDTILSCWSDWDGVASEAEQSAQDGMEWIYEMRGRLEAVLKRMVSDTGQIICGHNENELTK